MTDQAEWVNYVKIQTGLGMLKSSVLISLLVTVILSSTPSLANSGAEAAEQGQEAGASVSFLLQGSGKFTYDGITYKPFVFKIICQGEGSCSGSSMEIGGSKIPVNIVSYSHNIDRKVILLESDRIQCSVYDLGSGGEGEKMVFNCMRPLGSGISFDAIKQERQS